MKIYSTIRQRFLSLNQTTREWFPKSGFPKTAETINAIIHRDQPTDPTTLVFLAFCLGFASTEILELLAQYDKERPEKHKECYILRKLIAPVELSEPEQALVERWRRLDTKGQQLIDGMLAGMGV